LLKKILVITSLLILNVFASTEYEEGKKVFESKCSSCHGSFVEINKLKENFFDKDNKLLNLKAPTVNMLAYAIMDSPKKIGDPTDPEMRQIEIEEFLKSYLEKPDRFNSICDDHILKYYETKSSMKGILSDDDYVNLSYFFMEYKQNLPKKDEMVLNSDFDEKKIVSNAQKEDKLIMVYATSQSCYFCRKMERNVLSQDDIKQKISQNYIYVKIDVEEKGLPFNLQKEYKKITPSFFVLDKNGKFITQYPGSWTKSDFEEILKENIK